MNKRFQAVLLGAIVTLAMGGGGAFAVCTTTLAGHAIFQCGNQAFFAPPPIPPVFDPNANPINYTSAFWQIGFGNNLSATGLGGGATGGTGNTGLTFNGNDNGLWVVDLKDTNVAIGNPLIPSGSMCLSVNDWGDSGIDGCVENARATTQLSPAHVGILNPDYDIYAYTIGAPGYYNYTWHGDYGTMVLVKGTPDARYFAVAAVSTNTRPNDHTATGPCNLGAPGTNQAACDSRPGFYNFQDVANGQANPITALNNVIPFQSVPRPAAACTANCSGTTPRTVTFTWNPVRVFNDQVHMGTTHPLMGGGACVSAIGNPVGSAPCIVAGPDTTRARGVGAQDTMLGPTAGDVNHNWAGLVRYDLEVANVTAVNLDPNGNVLTSTLVFAPVTGQTDIFQPGLNAVGDPVGQVVRAGVTANVDTCYRVHVKFGKKPETGTGGTSCGTTIATTTANSRVGKCGDRGYEAFSLDPGVITCVGGSLVSEKAVDLLAVKKVGTVTLTWRMTAELGVEGFNIYTVSPKGVEKKIGSLPCQQCTSGQGASYTFTAPLTQIKGSKSLVLEVLSTNGNSKTPVSF